MSFNLATILQDSGAQLLFTFEQFAEEAVKAADGVPVHLSTCRPTGTHAFDELYAAEDTGELEPVHADDTAVLLYTSGTTGSPKDAELTHFQLYMNCTVGGRLFAFRDDDIGLAVLPLFHVFGLSSVLNVAVRFGGALALVPRFETASVLDAPDSAKKSWHA